jgi:ATP synthase protein I
MRSRGKSFKATVGARAARKIRARRERRVGIWFGLGASGIVGWSVAIPTLIGVAVGVWIDSKWPGGFSWTLMLLVAGVILGCLNAWYWVARERRAIERREEDDEHE